MARKVDVDDLVAAADIARRLGVGKSTVVHDWRYRHPDFPQPVTKVGSVLIWAWPDVEAWAKATGRLK